MRYLKENKRVREELERMEELVDRVNELYYDLELDTLVDNVKETENFKVYDLYGFAYDNNIDDELLEMYINDQWELFRDDFVDVELHQLGRTSSNYISVGFYTRELINRDGYKYFNNEKLNVVDLLQEITLGTHLWGVDSVYDIDGSIDYKEMEDSLGSIFGDTEEDNIEEIVEKLEDINNEVLEELIDTLENDNSGFIEEMEMLREVRQYIKDFKDNQVEDFKEWLELMEVEVDIQE